MLFEEKNLYKNWNENIVIFVYIFCNCFNKDNNLEHLNCQHIWSSFIEIALLCIWLFYVEIPIILRYHQIMLFPCGGHVIDTSDNIYLKYTFIYTFLQLYLSIFLGVLMWGRRHWINYRNYKKHLISNVFVYKIFKYMFERKQSIFQQMHHLNYFYPTLQKQAESKSKSFDNSKDDTRALHIGLGSYQKHQSNRVFAIPLLTLKLPNDLLFCTQFFFCRPLLLWMKL